MRQVLENSRRAFRYASADEPTLRGRDWLEAQWEAARLAAPDAGRSDDYVPAAGCRAHVERLRKAGKDITLTEYPGAHHVFDNPALKTPVKLAQAQTTRSCPLLEETPDGRIVNSQTKQPFTYASDPCVERGTTVAYDAQAHAEVVKALAGFLTATLQLK